MANPKTMYMHIGLPKTGTSSIQLVLHTAAATLAKQGILYPPDPRRSPNHGTFLSAIGGRRIARLAGRDPIESQALVAEITGEFRSDPVAKSLVWSHESLAMSFREWDYRFLTGLTAALDLTVILYVRFVSDWMESQYRQLVWGQSLRPMENITREKLLDISSRCERWLGNADAANICDRIAERLPGAHMRVRSFDADRDNGKLIPAFLEMIGANVSTIGDAEIAAAFANASRPTVDTALLHALWQGALAAGLINRVAKSLVATARSAFIHDSGVQLRFVPSKFGQSARSAYAGIRERFPQLPAQPEHNESPTPAAELRARMLARLESVRGQLDEDAFAQVLSVLQ